MLGINSGIVSGFFLKILIVIMIRQVYADQLPPACISRPAFRNHSAASRTLAGAVVSPNVFSLDS